MPVTPSYLASPTWPASWVPDTDVAASSSLTPLMQDAVFADEVAVPGEL